MQTNYYNTTHSTHPELGKYEQKAKSQEEKILRWFKQDAALANSSRGVSPSVVKAILFPNAPLTSIRRAMTNLTNQGELVKSDQQRKGPFGRPEYMWILPTGQQRLF